MELTGDDDDDEGWQGNGKGGGSAERSFSLICIACMHGFLYYAVIPIFFLFFAQSKMPEASLGGYHRPMCSNFEDMGFCGLNNR